MCDCSISTEWMTSGCLRVRYSVIRCVRLSESVTTRLVRPCLRHTAATLGPPTWCLPPTAAIHPFVFVLSSCIPKSNFNAAVSNWLRAVSGNRQQQTGVELQSACLVGTLWSGADWWCLVNHHSWCEEQNRCRFTVSFSELRVGHFNFYF